MEKIRFAGEENDERFAEIWTVLNVRKPTVAQLDEARKQLDGIKDKDAEWHYVYAAVDYYKRFYSECRKHLKKAIKLDSEKEKYKTALQELEEMVKFTKKAGKPLYTSNGDAFAEGFCECCGEVFCEGICSGF